MEIGMVLKVGEWGYELLGIFNWTGQFPVPVVGDEEKVWWFGEHMLKDWENNNFFKIKTKKKFLNNNSIF